ncbi:hypothetical protein AADG75_RS24950, partial [Escherichia coli]
MVPFLLTENKEVIMRYLYGAILFFTTLPAVMTFPAQAAGGHGAFSVGYAQVHPGGVPVLS